MLYGENSEDRRRVKRVLVPWHLIEDLMFVDEGHWPKLVGLARFGLPPGSRIVNSREASFARCVEFLVHHPSFPVVESATEPPDFRAEDLGVNVRVYERVDK